MRRQGRKHNTHHLTKGAAVPTHPTDASAPAQPMSHEQLAAARALAALDADGHPGPDALLGSLRILLTEHDYLARAIERWREAVHESARDARLHREKADRLSAEVHNYEKAVTRIRGAIANEAMQGKRPALDPVLDALRVLQKNVGAGS